MPIEVQRPDEQRPVPDTKKIELPATEKQKDYARSLGIEFADDASRPEMSKLIDAAVERRDSERFEKLHAIDALEIDVRDELRKEILAEIDAEDYRLSVATAQQIVQALSDRGHASILIQMPWDDIEDFKKLSGLSSDVSFPVEMTLENVEDVIKTYAISILKRDGVL